MFKISGFIILLLVYAIKSEDTEAVQRFLKDHVIAASFQKYALTNQLYLESTWKTTENFKKLMEFGPIYDNRGMFKLCFVNSDCSHFEYCDQLFDFIENIFSPLFVCFPNLIQRYDLGVYLYAKPTATAFDTGISDCKTIGLVSVNAIHIGEVPLSHKTVGRKNPAVLCGEIIKEALCNWKYDCPANMYCERDESIHAYHVPHYQGRCLPLFSLTDEWWPVVSKIGIVACESHKDCKESACFLFKHIPKELRFQYREIYNFYGKKFNFTKGGWCFKGRNGCSSHLDCPHNYYCENSRNVIDYSSKWNVNFCVRDPILFESQEVQEAVKFSKNAQVGLKTCNAHEWCDGAYQVCYPFSLARNIQTYQPVTGYCLEPTIPFKSFQSITTDFVCPLDTGNKYLNGNAVCLNHYFVILGGKYMENTHFNLMKTPCNSQYECDQRHIGTVCLAEAGDSEKSLCWPHPYAKILAEAVVHRTPIWRKYWNAFRQIVPFFK